MPYIVSRDRRSSFAPTEILRRRRTTVGVDRERLPAIYVATFVWRAPLHLAHGYLLFPDTQRLLPFLVLGTAEESGEFVIQRDSTAS